MFADAALGARIDRAEARMVAQMTQPPERGGGSLVQPISGGLAIFAAPSSPMNKVIGLGFDTDLDLDALSAIEEAWRARGEPVRIELSALTDPAMASALGARGYALIGFENVLGRRLDDLPDQTLPPHLSIEALAAGDTRIWKDVMLDAFSNMDGTGSVADPTLSRDELERLLPEFDHLPGFTPYLARVDGIPAGEAGLRIDEHLAQMAGSGTVPAFRGRGVQKGLVQRRLQDARAAGCDLAVVTTAPGTRSQDNVMRRGFVLLYTRAILVRRWHA